MIDLVAYFILLILFFAINFNVLKALNIENFFKKNHVWQIKAAYIILSLAFAHILAEILMKFYEWAQIILK
ncbi:DUF1146 family protein [Haploplasma modicum]|jgi:uncharacterized membrane protein YwzB|uniref:DUF1146 family protein n=1 Tax=Haploplasma modicum TaxID=2150 RepID=UPI00047C9552|nr:DUF1146 family protein [Haploplasma modicum]